ncbi:unnamed protein product [Brugia timori]|uniref:Ferritin n=1 Tax=Brugia timori TaxID=42155 RepID=A0A0R3QPI5_9BILA|nr:unnamed protein product [Brugia timori]
MLANIIRITERVRMKALYIDRSNEQNWDTDEMLMQADFMQQSFFFMQFLQILI